MITGTLVFDIDIEVVNEEALNKLSGEIKTRIECLNGVLEVEESVDYSIIECHEYKSSESPE